MAQIVFSNGVYEGGVDEAGMPDGAGKLAYADGSVYEGQWFSGSSLLLAVQPHASTPDSLTNTGKITGHGTFTYTNGDAYEGMCVWDWCSDSRADDVSGL